jgi:hypothetical protein
MSAKKLLSTLILGFFLAFCVMPGITLAKDIGILVEEVDGTPSGYAYKLKVSNGSLSLSGAIGTLDMAAASVPWYTKAARDTAIPSPTTNQTVGITDGSTDIDCTVGGGSTFNLCVYNGAAWVIVGDGAQGAGTGSVTTLEEGDSQIGGQDIVYLDFGVGFALVESPDTEVNIDLDVTPSSGSATLIVEEDSVQVKYDSTDFQESTNGLYLGASPTMTGSPVVGTALLADAQDGAVLGSATLQFSDLYLADGAKIELGDDTDVTITHVADVGITMASVAPDITLVDDTAGDGTGNLLFSTANAGSDIVATVQVDVANAAVTYLTLDGTNERVTVGPTPNDNNIPFVIQGDADSDAEDTADLLSFTLTGNTDPTAAIWGITSTQSAGYTFDKTVSPSASDGAALGTTSLEWQDLYIADAGKIDMGDDQDVTITHVADVGITMASVAPDITLVDDTAGDGTGNLLFSTANAGSDIVATLQADIANTPTTFISLDGTNEEVLFGKKIDIASLGIENVGAIADDGAISVISSSGAVTIESVVFTGGALTGVTASDGLTIGDGGSTNYITISDTGGITFTGSADIDLPDDSVDAADIGTDQVTMDAIDADGTFTSLTGAWTTTGALGAGDTTVTSAAPAVLLQDSTNAAGTGTIILNSSGGAHDVVLTIGVEAGGSENVSYVEVDGVTETVDLLKPVVASAEIFADALGIEFEASDDISDCSSFSATGGGIWFDDSEGIFKKCQDNVATALDTGASTAYDDIGDPDADGTISFDNDEEATYTSAQAAAANDVFNFVATGAFGDISIVKIDQNTGNATDGTMLEIATDDDAVDHLLMQYGANDYVTAKMVDAGTITWDITLVVLFFKMMKR